MTTEKVIVFQYSKIVEISKKISKLIDAMIETHGTLQELNDIMHAILEVLNEMHRTTVYGAR